MRITYPELLERVDDGKLVVLVPGNDGGQRCVWCLTQQLDGDGDEFARDRRPRVRVGLALGAMRQLHRHIQRT